MSELINDNDLEKIIVGRYEPRIYAFLTKTVPRYLKVGDTYRPVPVRIAEWQKRFEINNDNDVWDWPAVIDGKVFFRDYSVHQFLVDEKNLDRLTPQALDAIGRGAKLYFSNEFFLGGKVKQVEEAIEDIKTDHEHSGGKYSFYDVADIGKDKDAEDVPIRVPLKLRPNQEDAVNRFKAAIVSKRTNLLMYAVMRFGKTVTSLKCAEAMKARFVVVVSGKADVVREWHNTVLGFEDFKEYVFLSRKDLAAKYTRVTEELKAGHKVVLFATLQDLQGDAIKPRHKQIFANQIDLLIVDETHFAARADEYGKALRVPKECKDAYKKDEDDAEEVAQALKVLNAKVRLHLSGTPYRILMGSEFQPQDIVSFCQFTDIIQAQQNWNANELGEPKVNDAGEIIVDDNGNPVLKEEWDNPYYGFPQMVRFAFNLTDSARKKLEEMEAAGKTSRFGELFRPMCMEKDSSAKRLHRKFVHEKEVVDLLRAIGGASNESGILPFLDYEIIRKGKMCHHIVCVLPYCASCDAMEALLDPRNKKYKGTLGRLGEYKVINISGKEVKKGFAKTDDVVKAIAECEERGIKTITLTVNRMLTGSTVPQWDTMLFLKDTSSPQEYDQAIFRLQSSFISIREDRDRKGKIIKFNMKPQTLLVDFDPARMFRLQEARAQYYNLNTDKNGNRELEERVKKELTVSPIILYNKGKMLKVEASDVMAAVSEYSAKRGVAEEVEEIPVDAEVCKDGQLRSLIDSLPEMGSKEGLTIKPHDGDETDINTDTGDGPMDTHPTPKELPSKESPEMASMLRRIKTYHALIVFYSFLIPDRVHSLDEILQVMEKNGENRRIARHLGLEKSLLELYRKKVNWSTLQKLDYKIQNLDRLANESGIIDIGPEYKDAPDEVKKAIVAMRKFGRLGESKIVTPPNIAYDMVKLIPAAELKKLIKSGEKILDPASKMGEFAIAIVRRCAEPDVGISAAKLKNSILSIPMCGVTYEFTRKVYELLRLDPNCIASPELLTSYKLLEITTGDGKSLDYDRIRELLTQKKDFNKISINDKISKKGKAMCVKVGAVISNPPYQSNLDSGRSLAKQLFPKFIEFCIKMNPQYWSLITPQKWFTADGQDNSFPKLRELIRTENHFQFIFSDDGKKLFPNTELGMVSYYLWNSHYVGNVKFVERGIAPSEMSRPLFEDGLDIILPQNKFVAIIKKVVRGEFVSLNTISTGRNAFGINGKGFENRSSASFFKGAVKVQCAYEEVRYVNRNTVAQKGVAILDSYKVFTSKGNGGAGLLTDGKAVSILGKAYVAEPGTACTDSLIPFGKFKSRYQADNLQKYMGTKFLRFLVGILKVSQNLYQNVYSFVPLQDFTKSSDIDWSKSIPEIDAQLYAKYGITKAEQEFIESMIKPIE